MSTTLAALIAACAPLVHPTTMRALIAVESAGNPFAVSINRPSNWRAAGAELPIFHQPRTAAAALRLIRHLHAAGFTTSVGLAQINTEHLTSWRLPLAALLDPCTNLNLAQRILIACSREAAPKPLRPLAQTLSCFNSGNPTTGIANGYAARVYRSALRHTDPSATPRSTRQ
jgi:type IV secretion system protein VirB1